MKAGEWVGYLVMKSGTLNLLSGFFNTEADMIRKEIWINVKRRESDIKSYLEMIISCRDEDLCAEGNNLNKWYMTHSDTGYINPSLGVKMNLVFLGPEIQLFCCNKWTGKISKVPVFKSLLKWHKADGEWVTSERKRGQWMCEASILHWVAVNDFYHKGPMAAKAETGFGRISIS